ncbi:MAG: hypothetical protein HYX74_09775 [Acidobacteria bacterium]|nr:hypothetical protein [Acidobacteriota bacterium]
MTDALEVRMAHLEGAYEQINKRLGGVEVGLGQLRSEMGQLRSEMNSGTAQLRSEMNAGMEHLRAEASQFRADLTGRMDGQLRWLLGTILTTWVTIILAIFLRP